MQLNEFQKITINQLVDKYVAHIEGDFDKYLKDEAYKFQAVSTFRKELNLDAPDLHRMFDRAFKDMRNLIGSGQYFPKKMLLQFIDQDKEFMRGALKELLNGKDSGKKKIDTFKQTVESKLKTVGVQTYFDYRFLSVLLASKWPDRYLTVKATEYKKFAQIIGYDLEINKNSLSQGERYERVSTLGNTVREVLRENPDFIKIHNTLVRDYEYKDQDLSWGTDDFIFNIMRREYSSPEELKKQNQWKRRIEEVRKEVEDDLLWADEAKIAITGKDKFTLLKEAQRFIPTNPDFIEKEGPIKVRRDNVIQKERVKAIENYMCQVCETVIEYLDSKGNLRKYVEADHIISKADGGTEILNNLWVLCPNCHIKKTLGVITIDLKKKVVRENNIAIKIHDAHLEWNK